MGNNVTSITAPSAGTLTLSVSKLKAFIAHASCDETRIHICGVYFDRDAIVATDGHRLIAAPIAYASPMGTWDPFLAPASDLKVAIKMAGAKGRVEIRIGERTSHGTGHGVTVGRKLELHAYDRREKHLGSCASVASDLMFPSWRQVVPRLADVKPIVAHVNPAYMADLALVADAFNTSTCDGVEYRGSAGNDLAPMIYAVGPDSCRDVIVVIMPMRGKYTGKCIHGTETEGASTRGVMGEAIPRCLIRGVAIPARTN